MCVCVRARVCVSDSLSLSLSLSVCVCVPRLVQRLQAELAATRYLIDGPERAKVTGMTPPSKEGRDPLSLVFVALALPLSHRRA